MKAFNLLKSAFLIVGTVVGAGFITGRELLTFFGGFDVLSIVVSFIVFYGLILLFSCISFDGIMLKINDIFLIFCNFFIVASMLACGDAIGENYLKIPSIYSVFSVSFIVIVSVVCIYNLRQIEKFSFFIVFSMILVVFIICVLSISKNGVVPYFSLDFNPVLYCVMNVYLSSAIIKSTTDNYSFKDKNRVALISSFVLTLLIFVILSALSDGFYFDSELPLSDLFDKGITRYVYLFVLLLGILTTLIGSYYTVISFFKKTRCYTFFVVLLPSVLFIISKSGFSFIVTKIYPIISVIGLSVFLISVILRVFFPLMRRCRTLLPPKRKA